MPRTKQFDREEVLSKAKELFWKQGYHATSVQDLVDHLRINRASLYDTFGGKNELYELAFQTYRQENLAFLNNRLASARSIREELKAIMVEGMQATVNDPDKKGCFIVNCTSEYLPTHPHILTELLGNKAEFQQIIANALQRGKENREFSHDLEVDKVAAYLYAFFNGLNIISKVQTDSDELLNTIELGLRILD